MVWRTPLRVFFEIFVNNAKYRLKYVGMDFSVIHFPNQIFFRWLNQF